MLLRVQLSVRIALKGFVMFLVVMVEDVYRKEYTRKSHETANIRDVITIIRGMITLEPVYSMKHIFGLHILHLFMPYINCDKVRDFYISLFDPNDYSMNLTIKLRENIYKYAYQTNLLINMASFMLHPA